MSSNGYLLLGVNGTDMDYDEYEAERMEDVDNGVFMVAPFWTDLVVRTGRFGAKVWLNEYHAELIGIDEGTTCVLGQIKRDVAAYTGNDLFEPTTAIVVTWDGVETYKDYNADNNTDYLVRGQ